MARDNVLAQKQHDAAMLDKALRDFKKNLTVFPQGRPPKPLWVKRVVS